MVKENVRTSQVSNVGYENKYRLIVVNNKYKLEEKYEREYKDIVKK